MKYKKLIFTVITIMLLLSTVVTPVFAESTGFVTEPMTEEQLNTFYENVSISLLTEEPPKRSIDVFDVNENGFVAIGCSGIRNINKTVCIYNATGEFQYGYSFVCYGAYVIEFNGDNLIIAKSRSDTIITLDSTGKILSVAKVFLDEYDNNSHWQFLDSRKRKVGDVEYILEKDAERLNNTLYPRLVTINENGEKNIIYDVTSSHYLGIKVQFVLVLILFCIGAVLTVRNIVKSRRGGW